MPSHRNRGACKRRTGVFVILDVAGLQGIDHVGLTVPNLEEAIGFFEQVFGAVVMVRHPPYRPTADSNIDNFGRHPDTVVQGIALIRIAGSVIELLAYESPDRREVIPRTSDAGGHHLAFYVDDLDSAIAGLREAGIEVLGEPLQFAGAEAGNRARFVYTRAPWGLYIEFVSYPEGKAYQS